MGPLGTVGATEMVVLTRDSFVAAEVYSAFDFFVHMQCELWDLRRYAQVCVLTLFNQFSLAQVDSSQVLDTSQG